MAGLINFSQRWSSAHHLLWDNHVSMPLPIIPLPLLRTGERGKVKERVRERDKLGKQNSGILKIMESCETFSIYSAREAPPSPELFFFNHNPALGPRALKLLSGNYCKMLFCLQNLFNSGCVFVSPTWEFSWRCRIFIDVVAALFSNSDTWYLILSSRKIKYF